MTSNQIEKNVNSLVKNINREEFIYDLLLSYGISKTSITRLKKGDFNLAKSNGDILYKKKVFFKEVDSDKLLAEIDEISKNETILNHDPRFVIVTDYKTLLAKDINTGQSLDIDINKLHKHYDFFLPWAGQEKYLHKNENLADRRASYEMARLYDILVRENPDIYADGGHNLNIFLSRLLFCFFAEDTDIFHEEGVFTTTLAKHTEKDGSDVHIFLNRLFDRLNSEDAGRFPDFLQKFPYVNGGLFRDEIQSPKFSKKARQIILECGDLNWSEINPDIFGSMIQAVVNPKYRSGLGMHYTSVPNIMKVIEPLFLNELNDEFEKYRDRPNMLRKLINRVSKIKIFDPACGSGNFLIIAYKELRRLEIQILARLNEIERQQSIVFTEIKLSQFYGIEVDDFAHEMAILSLWLAEHQMNKEFEEDLYDFGKSKPILPLKEAGHITCGNATRLNWDKICPKSSVNEIYVLGNPPYLGSRNQDKDQKEDMKYVFGNGYKSLDYVACWFYKGSEYIHGINSKLAFVSTNSICQGDQVALTWPRVLTNEIEIEFAHKSFKWTNNAKGSAAVTVIIVCLRNSSNKTKFIFYNGTKQKADNINAYLIDGKDIYIKTVSKSIAGLPKINFGNMPADGGEFIFTDLEKKEFVAKEPLSVKWFKELYSSREFLRGEKRWCLWLEGISEEELNEIPYVRGVVNKVKKIREKSSRPHLADIPHLFAQITQPENSQCIIIPRISSERRNYLPVGFLDSNKSKVTDSLYTIATDNPYIFGIVSSRMHLIWVEATGGKMKTDYRYAKNLSYNTFPFPKLTVKQIEQINLYVFKIIDLRESYPQKCLSDLYDPDKMPSDLKNAHLELDSAIERCYRLKPFESDNERLEYLFKEYEKLTNKN